MTDYDDIATRTTALDLAASQVDTTDEETFFARAEANLRFLLGDYSFETEEIPYWEDGSVIRLSDVFWLDGLQTPENHFDGT